METTIATAEYTQDNVSYILYFIQNESENIESVHLNKTTHTHTHTHRAFGPEQECPVYGGVLI